MISPFVILIYIYAPSSALAYLQLSSKNLQKGLESLQNFKLGLQSHLAEVFCHALFEVVYRYCQLIETLFHADKQVSRNRDGKGRLKSGRHKFLQKFSLPSLKLQELKALTGVSQEATGFRHVCLTLCKARKGPPANCKRTALCRQTLRGLNFHLTKPPKPPEIFPFKGCLKDSL